MRKIKKFVALVLAICLLSPALIAAACNITQNKHEISTELTGTEENDDLSPDDTASDEDDSSIPPDNSVNSDTNNENSSSNENTSSNDSEANSSSSSNTEKDSASTDKEETQTPSNPAPQKVASYIRCTGSNVNLRAGAGTDYRALGQAEKGTMYALIEKKDGWFKTYYRNQTVYLYASYGAVFTLEKSENSSVEKVISEGYRLLGVPYVYGAIRLHDGKGNLLKGFSAQKFDCSSLIQYIFYQGAGKLLNTTTRTQVSQGKSVKKSNIQRGDCLFFTNEERKDNVGIERIGHVALYLGDNYILHTASDYARIEKISATRWSYFLEARRFLS